MNGRNQSGVHGFTLIELMAVVAIIGLMLGIMLPNLAATRASQLEQLGRDLASRIDLARERAIVTSVPHRVWLELEEGAFRVDWFISEDRAMEDSDELVVPEAMAEQSEPEISLSPPKNDGRAYFPIPSSFGRDDWLRPDTYFEGVTTPAGWVEEGEVQLVFQRDGSTDYAEIVLADTCPQS